MCDLLALSQHCIPPSWYISSLKSSIEQLLVFHRERQGDLQLALLLHGALDGLISITVPRPAASRYLGGQRKIVRQT